jgi:hypothetical protein
MTIDIINDGFVCKIDDGQQQSAAAHAPAGLMLIC